MKVYLHGLRDLLFFILLTGTGTVFALDAPVVKVKPVPGWVETVRFEENQETDREYIKDGEYFLLVDEQTNTDGERQRYRHFAIKLLNEKAVEANSQFTVSYYPAFQDLVIHRVTLWRNGKAIEQPVLDHLKLLQREKELENLIYDESWTATLLLEDVRKGDVLEYSYTVNGSNPAFNGHIAEMVYMQWSVPVLDRVYRLIWPENKPINITKRNIRDDEIIVSHDSNGNRIYRLQRKLHTSTQIDSQSPDWFDPWDRINFSSVSDWEDVVNWGSELYRLAAERIAGTDDIVADIRKRYKSKIQQASAALRYVQDEIRYLGIEIGSGSYVPSSVSDTLRRRYGDCKDKTYLLLAIFSKLGIEAYPVLANTRYGENLSGDGPRMNAFNHVFVSAVIDGKTYWLETTTNNQAGTLDDIYQPDYGEVLVLHKGNGGLQRAKIDHATHGVVINERFDLREGVNSRAIYTINTVYHGSKAEKFRRDVAAKGKAAMSRQYLDFYTKYYQGITSDGEMVINDDRETNTIDVTEKYIVNNIWDDVKDEQKNYVTFYNNAVYPYVRKPKVINRTSPYRYRFPVNIQQNITVMLPEAWNIEDENFGFESPFFSYFNQIVYSEKEKKLELRYRFNSHVRYIPAEDIPAYINALEQIDNQTEYSIYSSYADTSLVESKNIISTLTIWLTAILVISAILVYSVVEIVLDRRKTPRVGEQVYYPVSSFRVFILTVITFGLYPCYLFYRYWSYVKRRDNLTIIPWARAIFYSVWFYPLFLSLRMDPVLADFVSNRPRQFRYTILAVVLFMLTSAGIVSIVVSVLSNTEHPLSYLLLPAIAACLLPLVEKINFSVGSCGEQYSLNSRWRPRHALLGILFVILSSTHMLSESNLIPNDEIISGDELWSWQTRYLQRIGVLKPEDQLLMFYSAAIFDYRQDGNGLTSNGVFSYWLNENSGQTSREVARYSDIERVSHIPSTDGEDDAIRIYRKDGSHFVIYTRAGDQNDFYLKLWEKIYSK